MIESIKHKELQKFFENGNSSKIHQTHRKRLKLLLTLLQSAKNIEDLKFPGFNLHKLSSDYKGYWSINVSGNWKIVFRFEKGDIHDMDYLDYH